MNDFDYTTSIKGQELFWHFFHHDNHFKNLVMKNWSNGKIRFFNEEEWKKIDMQNYIGQIDALKTFRDVFELGYNIGDCVGVSGQLSYSYDNVDIVAGILPMLKGTKNAELLGGHRWLEDDKHIIDTSLMLVIDKSLKEEMGYIEEQRLTATQLSHIPLYQARKEFTCDKNLKRK